MLNAKKKARLAWESGSCTPLGKQAPSPSPSSSRSSSVVNPTEFPPSTVWNMPKYSLMKKGSETRQIEKSIPTFVQRNELSMEEVTGRFKELKVESFKDRRLTLENASKLSMQDKNDMDKVDQDEDWLTELSFMWEWNELENMTSNRSIPGHLTRPSASLNNQFNIAPLFIYHFLHGDYDKFTEELVKALTPSARTCINSKKKCTICRNVKRFHQLEIIFCQSPEKVERFFSLIPMEILPHFNGMLFQGLIGSNLGMIQSLITTGYGKQGLMVIKWLKEKENRRLQDGYCISSDDAIPNNSILSVLILSGCDEELIMEYQEQDVFNALDIEEAELYAIQMNSMDRIYALERVRKAMKKEIEEMEEARCANRKHIHAKWDCLNTPKEVCKGFVFNQRRRHTLENRLHVASLYADGEVLKWVMNNEKSRMNRGNATSSDIVDVFLHTPLMNTILRDDHQIFIALLKELNAGIGPDNKENVWTVTFQHGRFTFTNYLYEMQHVKKGKEGGMHYGSPLAKCITSGHNKEVLTHIKKFDELKCFKHWNRDVKPHVKDALLAAMVKKHLKAAKQLVTLCPDVIDVIEEREYTRFPFNYTKAKWKEGSDEIDKLVRRLKME